jgi:hypothetical protein
MDFLKKHTLVAFKMSRMSVPLPGPISTRLKAGGEPIDCHTDKHHTAGNIHV